MTELRFLQIHTLHSYSSALLNRDDTGLAKRLPYGGVTRTRISSQCLKRHWRLADDPHALLKIDGATAAFRSRELVTQKVIDPLRDQYDDAVLDALDTLLQTAVYGDKGKDKKSRQTLLFGAPELDWLAGEAARLAPKLQDAISEDGQANDTASEKSKKNAIDEAAGEVTKQWRENFKANIEAMRKQTQLPAGLAAALFGRMVTSDPAANIDAPVHVAHAFTVHEAETESDYLTAVDDLKRDDDEAGADTIQETELTSGIFYGYVVVDVPGLVANTAPELGKIDSLEERRRKWLQADRTLAAEIVHNLLYLIAEVSPGAKLGSTAPYGRAELVLVEAGDRQPRSLAPAFRQAVAPQMQVAITALDKHLALMDSLYATGEARRVLHTNNEDLKSVSGRASLAEIATWLKTCVRDGVAS